MLKEDMEVQKKIMNTHQEEREQWDIKYSQISEQYQQLVSLKQEQLTMKQVTQTINKENLVDGTNYYLDEQNR